MGGKYTASNKHIVWVVPGFSANAEDDACIPPLIELLEYIQTHTGCEVSVVALQYPFSKDKYQLFGADIYPLNGKNKWFNKISLWKKASQILKDIHTNKPIDVLHSFWLGDTTLIAEAFAKQHKLPHFCTLMGQDVLSSNRHIHSKRLVNIPCIALSQFHAAIFEKNAKRKVKDIIPFGLKERTAITVGKPYDLIGIGSLIDVKNYELWIEVIRLVKLKKPDIKTILVGDGDQRQKLESLIQKNQLQNNITLAGNKKREEVFQLIDQSKLFLHTSKHEGQGYIFFEAMRSGLPILSTPVGYAIEDENIFKAIEPQLFADEILHLLDQSPVPKKYKVPTPQSSFERYWKYYKG